MEEIEAGVDAIFSESKNSNPIYHIGTKKWFGLRKWGFYYRLFLSIVDSNSYSLNLTPEEYLLHWQEYPRLMAILEVIQRKVRHKTHENLEAKKQKHTNKPKVKNHRY